MQIFAWLGGLLALVAAALSTPLSVINPPLPEPPKRATIVVGGDMMFDRHIRKMMRIHGPDHIFSCVKDEFAGADLVVANLEGPVTDAPSVSEGSVPETPENFTFTFPPEVVPLLKGHGISLVNLGNNHIMNFGRDGLEQTYRYLERGSIASFGDPEKREEDRVERIELGSMPLSFVNWSDWTSPDPDATVSVIAREKGEGRFVIVYTHWGDEYVAPSERVKRLARRFVDAGASIVIGSHPHIVLEREDYRGSPIYYSLGNLVFDQYWEESVRRGLLLRLEVVDGALADIEEVYTELERDGRVCPIPPAAH